jgi:hypothetical protein
MHGKELLQQLSEIKGFMLIFDCSDQEELILELVETLVSAARGSSGDSLEDALFHVLRDVLGEAEEVPRSVWVTLVELLTSRSRGRANSAVRVSRQVLRSLAHRSAALPINEFLNASLYAAPEDVTQLMQVSEAKYQRDALLVATFELYCIDPALVARVIPNLQADLQCEDADRRRAVTNCVGQLLAYQHESSAQMPLMSSSPVLVDRFLERLGDADEHVRVAAVDGVGAMLATCVASGERGPRTAATMTVVRRIGEELQKRCLDPWEEVRVRVVEVVENVSKSATGFQFLARVLPHIFHRIFDKKTRVREACWLALSRLYAQHALPMWIEGGKGEVEQFQFIPRLLFEAYSVFSVSRLGCTAQLEACLEEHLVGCGLDGAHRGLALVGLVAAVAGHEAAEKGFNQLLARKRDGHDAMRLFLSSRLRGGAVPRPVLSPEPGIRAIVPVPAEGTVVASGDEAIQNGVPPMATLAVEALARVNPIMEDRFGRMETHMNGLKRLDLIRDTALWKALDQSVNPSETLGTTGLGTQMTELNSILGRKGIEDLTPLLRRCILATWLLPDHLMGLLDLWSESPISGNLTDASVMVQRALVKLSKYFHEAFLPHVPRIAEHLQDANIESVDRALRVLAAVGKRHTAATVVFGTSGVLPALPANFVGCLIEAIGRLCGDEVSSADASSLCRKSLQTLGLLPLESAWLALGQILDWAADRVDVAIGRTKSICLNLVSACIDWSSGMLGCPASLRERSSAKEWIARARDVIHQKSSIVESHLQCAAVELFASAGDASEISILFQSCDDVSLRLHASVSSLRAVRRGNLLLSSSLLRHIAIEVSSAFEPDRAVEEVAVLLEELQKMMKPTPALVSIARADHNSMRRLKPTDRLRICATLPSLWAQSPVKQQRDTALRILQSSFVKAMRQSRVQQQPMIDFVVACFVHFLARVPVFGEEANSAVTAYPESTRIASLFVEALLRADQPKGSELARVVLRVTERMNHFIDREDPTSDKVHTAAYVLKYVVEKRCPDLGETEKSLQGVTRGCMPRELFELGRVPTAPIAKKLPLPLGNQKAPLPPHTSALTASGSGAATALPVSTAKAVARAVSTIRSKQPIPSLLACAGVTTATSGSGHSTNRSGMASERAASPPGQAANVEPRRLSFPSTVRKDIAESPHLQHHLDQDSSESKRRRIDLGRTDSNSD